MGVIAVATLVHSLEEAEAPIRWRMLFAFSRSDERRIIIYPESIDEEALKGIISR